MAAELDLTIYRTGRIRSWEEVLKGYGYKEKLEKLWFYLMHQEKKLSVSEEKAKELYLEILEHPMMELAYCLKDEEVYFRKVSFQRRRLSKMLS